MTAEQERGAVVAWLREVRGHPFTWIERIRVAYWALRYGELVYHASRIAAANFIERGHHLSCNPDNPQNEG